MEKLSVQATSLKVLTAISLLICSLFLESCACSCSDKKKQSGDENFSTIEKKFQLSKDFFKSAFEVYLGEKKIISTNQYKEKLVEVSRDQKSTLDRFTDREQRGALMDDVSGKFESLKPLVKANDIKGVVKELTRIMADTTANEETLIECNRKMAICYIVLEDRKNFSEYITRYNKLLDEYLKKEDDIIEKVDQ